MAQEIWLEDKSIVRSSIPIPWINVYGLPAKTVAFGFNPVKSNGHGGSNVTVVDVLLVILNVILRLRTESVLPPRLCDHIGIGKAAILIGMPTVNGEASATVIVLLPLVAPAIIGTVGTGGGHCALPKRNMALELP
jgi:hypothetical protein